MRTLISEANMGDTPTELEHRSGLDPDDYHRLTGFEGDWRDSWWDQDYLVFMAGQLGLGAAADVLDLGCGVGHWGQRLLPLCGPDATLTGIDAEESWMAEASRRAEERGLRARFQVASADALPFADGSFDLVTCQTLMMHVRAPATVAAEAMRVLRPGGLLLAAEPNNYGSSAAHLFWEPRATWAQAQAILELEYVIHLGKEALGEGFSSVAEQLPGLFDEVGFVDVGVRLNNQCAPRFPPYTHDRQSIELTRSAHAEGALMGAGGTFANGERMFVAGGGTAARFAELWTVARDLEAARLDAIDAGQHRNAGGHMHYLIWGRKPR